MYGISNLRRWLYVGALFVSLSYSLLAQSVATLNGATATATHVQNSPGNYTVTVSGGPSDRIWGVYIVDSPPDVSGPYIGYAANASSSSKSIEVHVPSGSVFHYFASGQMNPGGSGGTYGHGAFIPLMPADLFSKTILIDNPFPVAVPYRVLQNGETVASGYALPNVIHELTITELATDDPLIVQYSKVTNAEYDPIADAWWHPIGDPDVAEDEWIDGATVTPDPPGEPTETAPPVVIKPTNPTPPPSTSQPTTPQAPSGPPVDASGTKIGPTIWTNYSSDKAEDPVDKATFVQGIGKIEKAIFAGASPGSVGGQNDKAIADAAKAGEDATDAASDAGEAASSDIADAYGEQGVPTVSVPNGDGSLFVFSAFGEVINLNPYSYTQFQSFGEFIRAMATYAIALFYTWFAWSEFRRITVDVGAARQARGNALLGGTGAQATALIAAAAITVILISVPVGYWVIASAISVTSMPNSASAGGIAGAVYHLANYVLPLPFILICLNSVFILRKFGVVITVATSTLIRFVVP